MDRARRESLLSKPPIISCDESEYSTLGQCFIEVGGVSGGRCYQLVGVILRTPTIPLLSIGTWGSDL
eukprot:scaffold5798_cov173-Amphora_coffeaeformis.AAC.4